MRTARQTVELGHYFAIKRDLGQAVRDGNKDDTEFHLNELAAIKMHTDSERLRKACAIAIRAHFSTTSLVALGTA